MAAFLAGAARPAPCCAAPSVPAYRRWHAASPLPPKAAPAAGGEAVVPVDGRGARAGAAAAGVGLGGGARWVLAACAAALAGTGAVGARRRRQQRGGLGGGPRALVARRASDAGGGEDFYTVLGVNRSARERDIKAAFRKLARRWHPDVNKEPGAREKFERIAKAYEVLSDPTKRERYDRYGEAGLEGLLGGSGGPGGFTGQNLEDILGEVFGSMFGGFGGGRKRTSRGPQKGADLQCEVEFPFHVACFGGEWPVKVKREEVCKSCDGQGTKKNVEKTACHNCNGTGYVATVTRTPIGTMQTEQPCNVCNGSGIDPSAICQTCHGKGTTPHMTEVSVRVPAGCTNNNQLRVRNEGDKGARGGPPGDLYISVKVAPSQEFQREGYDIHTESVINVCDAMLGTTVKVRTIDGTAEIKVPAGTQPETKMRIRGRGVPKLGRPDERGDHYIRVKVEVPTRLSTSQAKLANQLRDTM